MLPVVKFMHLQLWVKKNMEHVEWYWQGKVENCGGSCSSGTLSTTNPTCVSQGLKPDLQDEKPATNTWVLPLPSWCQILEKSLAKFSVFELLIFLLFAHNFRTSSYCSMLQCCYWITNPKAQFDAMPTFLCTYGWMSAEGCCISRHGICFDRKI